MKNETKAWLVYAAENLTSAKILLEQKLLNMGRQIESRTKSAGFHQKFPRPTLNEAETITLTIWRKFLP